MALAQNELYIGGDLSMGGEISQQEIFQGHQSEITTQTRRKARELLGEGETREELMCLLHNESLSIPVSSFCVTGWL